MALPTFGKLTLQDVIAEFGLTPNTGLREMAGLGGAPSSGKLTLRDFAGREPPTCFQGWPLTVERVVFQDPPDSEGILSTITFTGDGQVIANGISYDWYFPQTNGVFLGHEFQIRMTHISGDSSLEASAPLDIDLVLLADRTWQKRQISNGTNSGVFRVTFIHTATGETRGIFDFTLSAQIPF